MSSNKTIAKNALFLYIRMIVLMCISLITSRETLRILGIEDYGIYGIICGIIVLFAFFQTALTSSAQRFFSFEIGRGVEGNVRKAYGASISIHVILVIFILIIAETIGLWAVNNFLNIPEGRSFAANVIYHISILTLAVNIIRTPFNSAIIAYEKMSFYAYISIAEAVLKLLVVYALIVSDFDRLILYAILLLIVSLVVLLIYAIYVRFNFKECRFNLSFEKSYFSSMISFSGWSLLGGVSNVTAQQGCNVLLNVYVNVVANAAFGIANQVSQAIYMLSSNILKAFEPPIVKEYSTNNTTKLYPLVFRSSLMCFYLMLIVSIPICFKMDFVLNVWLSETPQNAVGFCVLMLVYQLIDAQQGPLNCLIHATGKIKKYYIWLSLMLFCCLPLSWLFLVAGFSPIVVILIRTLMNLATALIRVVYMKKVINFPLTSYLNEVIKPSFYVLILSVFVSYILNLLLPDTILSNFIFIAISIFSITLIIYICGISDNDKKVLIKTIFKNNESISSK